MVEELLIYIYIIYTYKNMHTAMYKIHIYKSFI